jgi:hypothetical protein
MVPILAKEASLQGPQVIDLPAATGVAFPITTAQACTRCHGPRQALEPKVLEVLAKRYPRDAATGFEKGDRRGWFWVEVPKKK